MAKNLLFSVTAQDCEWQTMAASSKGGQHANRNQTAVRCIHSASGAVGVSREYKSQIMNKRAAFERMAKTDKFQRWAKIQASKALGQRTPEQIVEDLMEPRNLKIEYNGPQGWQETA